MNSGYIVETFKKGFNANWIELSARVLVQIVLGILGFPGTFVGSG
jgi:hypothetical protein